MYGWSDDPSKALSDTVASAQSGVGVAGLFSMLLLLGVGFLVFRPTRRKTTRIWKRE